MSHWFYVLYEKKLVDDSIVTNWIVSNCFMTVFKIYQKQETLRTFD